MIDACRRQKRQPCASGRGRSSTASRAPQSTKESSRWSRALAPGSLDEVLEGLAITRTHRRCLMASKILTISAPSSAQRTPRGRTPSWCLSDAPPDSPKSASKAAAGAAEYLPVIAVKNLNRCLDHTQRRVTSGFTDSTNERRKPTWTPISAATSHSSSGGEGQWPAPAHRREMRLPHWHPRGTGQIASLNVSVAAGITLFESPPKAACYQLTELKQNDEEIA